MLPLLSGIFRSPYLLTIPTPPGDYSQPSDVSYLLFSCFNFDTPGYQNLKAPCFLFYKHTNLSTRARARVKKGGYLSTPATETTQRVFGLKYPQSRQIGRHFCSQWVREIMLLLSPTDVARPYRSNPDRGSRPSQRCLPRRPRHWDMTRGMTCLLWTREMLWQMRFWKM